MRQYRRLLDAGIFEAVSNSVETYINAKWGFNWKADKDGWSTKPKSRLEARGDQQIMGVGFR